MGMNGFTSTDGYVFGVDDLVLTCFLAIDAHHTAVLELLRLREALRGL